MGFAIGSPASDQRARAGGESRVDAVDIECHGEAARSSGSDGDGVADAGGHTAFVDIGHRKEIIAKPELFNPRAFAGVDVAGADMGKVLLIKFGSKAAHVDEFGVAVRWSEARSRRTHENAAYSAQMLKAAGITRVVLVAHAADMRRATGEFADAGIETIPAATGIAPDKLHLVDLLPSVSGLGASYHALYEMAALVVRRLRPD